MDASFLIPVLALLTLLGGCIWALYSKQQIHARLKDSDTTKSTLAADKSSQGKPADV